MSDDAGTAGLRLRRPGKSFVGALEQRMPDTPINQGAYQSSLGLIRNCSGRTTEVALT